MQKNVSSVETALENKKVLTVTSYGYLAQERAYIDRLLHRYLHEVRLPRLMTNLAYCVHELAGNAHKANLKRIYFADQGLDIFDPSDYIFGMKSFKEEVLNNPVKFSSRQRERGYYVKFHFHALGSVLKIVIRNNARLVPEEKRRILEKFRIAKSACNLADAYGAAEDYSEGAGLGIVMLHVMLGNMGFRDRSFRVYGKDGETISFLRLDVKDLELFESPYLVDEVEEI
ncbi:MAG: hypothetical protein ACOC2B_05130 [Sediminispirochaetaceae bacterium]